MSLWDAMINTFICILLMCSHIDEKVLFPFFSQIMLWSSTNLAHVWSAGGHSWTSCFTISESISQRYYTDLSACQIFSHSVLSVEGMMSATANKVCEKSLNKAWNWRDACLSEAPTKARVLLRQTGTAAHLQTAARFPFGLPIKVPGTLSQHF